MSPPHAIRIAIVAPSLRILGGHAVQARRLLDAWRADPAVDAWLVRSIPAATTAPMAPARQRPAHPDHSGVLLALLLRELGRADVARVLRVLSFVSALAVARHRCRKGDG